LLSSDAGAGKKVMRAAMAGVSTRNYGKAVEDAAEVAGISRSCISRRLVEETGECLKELMERPVPKDILVLTLDGIHMGEQVAVGAVGIDSKGAKHALGVADGTTENSAVAGDLLRSLVSRGLDIEQKILFLTDGAKALKAAIRQVCGAHHEIQRCREHKIRNVTDRVPKAKVKYVRAYMRAAWKLPEEQGVPKMKRLAQELQVSHPDAARSLLEGLEDTFTVNRLGLPPLLIASLQSTNISESVNSVLRTLTGRTKNFKTGKDQVLRWVAAGLLQAQKGFRLIKGHKQLWMLTAALGRTAAEEAV
jgi:transposase-like protein